MSSEEGSLLDVENNEKNGENMEEEVSNASGNKRVYKSGDAGRCTKVASKNRYSKKKEMSWQSEHHKRRPKIKKRSPASLKKV